MSRVALGFRAGSGGALFVNDPLRLSAFGGLDRHYAVDKPKFSFDGRRDGGDLPFRVKLMKDRSVYSD